MSKEYLIVLHMGCFIEMRISIKENAEILFPVLIWKFAGLQEPK